jgi:Lon protease-like protein
MRWTQKSREQGVVVDSYSDLPLFPLNTVLFPGMVLPLHIFEERYKLMIGRCLEEGRPFGVLLIREGAEVGGHAVPYEVGTTAVIAGAHHGDDGKINLVTIGSERFRLRSLRHDQPYLVGDAEPWPLAGEASEQARRQVEPAQALLRQYLRLLEQAEGHEIKIEEVPDGPRGLALLVAIALQIPLIQKQGLLAEPDVPRMLAAERAILRREEKILEHIVRTQKEQWEGGFSGYLAKN